MGLFDYIAAKKTEARYIKDIDEAENVFLRQEKAIRGIKDTPGLEEIVNFWKRQQEINENMFESCKAEEKDKYFSLYRQSKSFLNFIDNLLG